MASSSQKSAPTGGKKQYDDTNRGVLFQNDKEGNEARPDFTGRLDVDGVSYRISAWTKQSEKVGDFLSLSVQASE